MSIDRAVNVGVVGFRGSTQPTGGNPTIKQKLNLMGISASLLADPKSDSTVVQVGSFIDLPMTQSGMPDQGAILITRTSGGISQIGINPDRVLAFDSSQIGIDQNSPAQIGSSQIGSSQIGSSQNSRSQVSTSQIGIPQIGESQTTVTKTGSKQIGSTQVAVTQFNPEQVSTTQVNSPQIQNSFINFPVSQFDPLQSTSLSIGRIQIDSSKVAFASSVSLQQLLSSNLPSHELVSTYLQQFQSTLATDWNLPTSFNLTFNITDLPTGQLAEGTITGYDTIDLTQIINQPTHGTLTQTPDGKLTYQPIPTYIGNDSFTYLGFGSDGQISNLATVNLTVNNLPPTIETILIPTKINEGQNINLGVNYSDAGIKDTYTYTIT